MLQSRSLLLSVFLLGVSSLVARAEGPAAAAGKGAQVFAKHCVECHGGAASGGLALFDRAALSRVAPATKPDTSELIDLVSGGIMPPGKRPKLTPQEVKDLRDWVAAGAPPVLGDEYVWNAIAEDAEKLGKTRLKMRYFTLNHRLAAGDSATDLANLRKQLNALLQHFSGARGDLVTPIEPTETVVRIDLTNFKWDDPPMDLYTWSQGAKKPNIDQKPPFNRFDMVLLEYPYGVIPANSKSFTEIATVFLRPTDAVRPIPAVRGDWFLARASGDTLGKILETPAKTATLPPGLGTVYEANVTPAVAAAELGAVPASFTAMKRADWEKEFPQFVARQSLGTPILLDDTLLEEDRERNPLPKFTVEWRNGGTNKATSTLEAGDVAYLSVKNDTDKELYFETILTTATGVRVHAPLQFTELVALKPGAEWETPPLQSRKPLDNTDVGALLAVVFVSPTKFPPGQWYRTPDMGSCPIPARVVHPFYTLGDGGLNKDSIATGVSRQTAKLTVKKKGA